MKKKKSFLFIETKHFFLEKETLSSTETKISKECTQTTSHWDVNCQQKRALIPTH